MLPFAAGASASFIETGASYVGSQFNFLTSSTLSTLGAASGDLLIVMRPGIGSGAPTLSSGGSVTDLGAGYYSRVLNSSDIAGTCGWSGGGAGLVIYRGASSVALVVSGGGPSAGSGQSQAGFIKNPAHAGLVGILYSADTAILSIDSPAAWTTRGNYDPTGFINNDQCLVTDRLQPVNPLYVSGTAFKWSSTGTANGLNILELRT